MDVHIVIIQIILYQDVKLLKFIHFTFTFSIR